MVQDVFVEIYRVFFDLSLVIAPAYLLIALVAAWGHYRSIGQGGGFWRWLLPKATYLNRSHLVDLQLFVVTRMLAMAGILGQISLTAFAAALVVQMMPAPLMQGSALSPLGLALILWVASDFVSYWAHRLFHHVPNLWPLHAVHHSAEVMTPITTYRHHPVEIVMVFLIQTFVVGVLQGLLVGQLSPGTGIAQIAGINAFIIVANAGLAALHHSHVGLRFPAWLEHIVISPAQHQIHHSIDRAHYDRNYGTTLALWDWMFGTLYLSRAGEKITFGLQGAEEKPLQSQRLSVILVNPIRRALRLRG